MIGQTPEHNLGLEMIRVTEAAAMASARWMGLQQKENGDQAAVDAMRLILNTLPMDGKIVIGEGEKDDAPMLYNGERVGSGIGQKMDIAVDPVEGTRLLAFGQPNAIAVIAAAPHRSMWDPNPSFYMEKMVVGPQARDAIDLNLSVKENLNRVAEALEKHVQDLTVFVLEKKRHEQLIAEIIETGARISLHTDGDVAGALMAVVPWSSVDLLMGTGGAPEGTIAAVAIKALGGQLLERPNPQSDAERKAVLDAGRDLDLILDVDDLISSDDIYFAATGITSGSLLKGVEFDANGARTYSMMVRGKTGTVRYIEAIHHWDRLLKISQIDYGIA